MDTLRWGYDVVASDTFRRLQSLGHNHGDSYSRLKRFHTLDPVLEQFWQASRKVPVWVDWEQLRRGQAVCKRYAAPMLIGFAFQGFAGEIAAALGPAEVLVRTGGLSQRNIIARVEATLRWLLEVTQSIESLQADGPGFISTVRVRLRHAAVRHRMLNIPKSHPAYLDTASHGVPINTYDSILTLTFFCCNPIWKQLPLLGIHLTTQQAEDLVALFRFLAHLLGVPTDCFSSAAEARKTMEDIKASSVTPSESSRAITHDFICAFADRAPYNVSRGFMCAGIRAMNPASVCNALGVEKPGWTPYIAFVGLRWSIKLALLAQAAGFPLPSASDMIQNHFAPFAPLELRNTGASGDGSVCGLDYESAFPSRCRNIEHSTASDLRQCNKTNAFRIERPVETVFIAVVGVLSLLAVILAAVVVKLSMTLRK